MPYGDPPPWGFSHGRPIWIDPRFFDHDRSSQGWGWQTTRVITDNVTIPYPQPVDEQQIRKIVREEIADLPISFDVPDEPPES